MFAFSELKGFQLKAFDGLIGQARDLYVAQDNWTVRFLIARFGSWFSDRFVLLPGFFVDCIQPERNWISVAMTKLQIRHAASLESKHYLFSGQHRLNGGPKAKELAGSVSGSTATPGLAPLDGDRSGQPAEGEAPRFISCEELTSGYTLHAIDGKVGSIADVIIDDDEWRLRYLVVQTGVLFSRRLMLLSVRSVDSMSVAKREIQINWMRSSIEEGPDYHYFKKYIMRSI